MLPGPLVALTSNRVLAQTAQLVNAVHAWGGRVMAVGTTVVRALETVTARDGTVTPLAELVAHVTQFGGTGVGPLQQHAPGGAPVASFRPCVPVPR